MVLNATFNNISVISWRSVLLETGGPGEKINYNKHICNLGDNYIVFDNFKASIGDLMDAN
jgi:hypothetical protein